MHFFEDIKNYIGFDEGDVDRLRAVKPVVSPYFEEVVEEFYDALMDHKHTRDIIDGPAQLERLQCTLLEWLDEIFTGPFDLAYYQRRQRIGQAHVDVGLRPQYMFGAMNLIRVQLVRLVRGEDHDLDVDACIGSIERILDLELTIMLDSYWKAMMQEKLDMASALATGLAHEIRNPLNAIGLNLTLLERRLSKVQNPGSNYRPMLDAVRTELDRIEALTKDIRDFAKPMSVNRRWHDAESLAAEIETVHGPTLDATEIEFDVDVKGTPELYCDADRLKQALLNLLKNAIEAIEDDGTIAMEIVNKETRTVIRMTDSGGGMAPSATQRVFDLFYTTKASGTGIGLPIVKKIVEAHQGSIDFISRDGEGTTFRIVLPRPAR